MNCENADHRDDASAGPVADSGQRDWAAPTQGTAREALKRCPPCSDPPFHDPRLWFRPTLAKISYHPGS